MWTKISSALKLKEGSDYDTDHRAESPSPPDPFCANATTYYANQVPPSPPASGHSRTASREEDIIWSLRTQLALQQELCAQFEIDLRARDELVEALTARLAASENESEKRRTVVRSWKKKAADLERMCRHLEVVVDNSRRESMERSVMDEASGEALRQLHRQISQLERERDGLTQVVRNAEAEIVNLRGQAGPSDKESDERFRQLETQLTRLKHERAEADAEAFELRDQVFHLRQEKDDIATERDNFSSEVSRLQDHVQQLQKNSAAMEVTIVQLNKQRNQDKEDMDGLNIALESKQQELELVKRKNGTRGLIPLAPVKTSTAFGSRKENTQPTSRPHVKNILAKVEETQRPIKRVLP